MKTSPPSSSTSTDTQLERPNVVPLRQADNSADLGDYEEVVPHTTSREQVTQAIVTDVNNGTLFDFEIISPSDFGPDEPPPQKWLVKDWIPRNITAGIYGQGGVGKSYVIQQLCYALAGGVSWCGLEVPEGPPVRSLMIMGEDGEDQIRRRHYNLATGMGFLSNLKAIETCEMYAGVGKDLRLGVFNQSTLEMSTTKFFKTLLDQVIYGQFTFLTLDTVSDIFSGNENDRTQVNAFVKRCIGAFRLAVYEATGLPLNIMMVGHPPKRGIGYSGSTAWNAALRARLEFQADEDVPEVRRLFLPKSNYAPMNDSGVQVIMENGAFVPLVRPGPERAQSIRARIIGIVADNVAKGRPLQDAPKHAHGLVPVAMARLKEMDLPVSQGLSVLQEVITEAREGFGALRIQKASLAKDQGAGFIVFERSEK